MMGILRLALLGPPLVTHRDDALKLPTRKTLALLIYLAMTSGIHSRAHLARLFWPDSAPAQRLTTLRSKLHALRQALGEISPADSPYPSAHPHLIVQHDVIGIEQEYLEIDVKQLQNALLQTVVPGSASAAENRLTRLAEVALLVRGSFLQDLTFDDLPAFDEWLTSQRAYWQQQVDWLFEQFSQLALQHRSGGYAEQVARMWLTHNPTSEAAHCSLMHALLAQGKPAESLTIYLGYQRLVQELQLPAITSEMKAVVALAQSSEKATSSVSMPPAMIQAGRTGGNTPFDLPLIGRDQEVGQLIHALQQANADGVQLMRVCGEAGIGKTHLVAALTNWAQTQRTTVLWGRGFESGGQLPYSPFLEALRPRLELEHAPEDLLEDVWLSELSRLFPELQDRYPDLASPLPEGSEGPVRLFEAVNLLMVAWAKRTPLLLVFDDVQWIDHATQDLLLYLLHRWKSQQIPILVVLVERLDATESTTHLTTSFSEIERTIPTRSLELRPLREQDVRTIVGRLILPRDSSWHNVSETEALPEVAEFSHWLFCETEGYPLFLVHTLRELLERRLLHYNSTAQAGRVLDVSLAVASLEQLHDWVPMNIQDMIVSRLARLSTEAQSLLDATAVLGQDATFARICRVASLSETVGLQALEEVLDHRLLREYRQSQHAPSPSYAFSHEKIRAVVIMRIRMTRLCLFHQYALDVLEQQSLPAATLAFHALKAGATPALLRYSMQAGDDAMAVFAVQDAIALYRQALACLEDVHESYEVASHLHLHLGRAYELVGQWVQARATYETMLMQARRKQDTRLIVITLMALAILVVQCEFDLRKAQCFLSEAQVLAAQSGDSMVMGEIAWNLSQIEAHGWQTTLALAEGERALELATTHHLTELTARSLYLLGFIMIYRGEFDHSAHYLQAALDHYAQMDRDDEQNSTLTPYLLLGGPSPSYQWTNQDAVIGCLCILMMDQICLGKLQDAHETIQRALVLSQDHHNIWAITWARYNLNHVLLEQGAYEQAQQSILEALESIRQVPNTVSHFYALVIYSFTLQELGFLDKSFKTMEEALALIQAFPVPTYQTLLLPWMCVNRGLAGDWETATQYAIYTRPLRASADAILLMMGFTSPYETEALLRGGYVEWAHEEVEQLGRRMGINRRFHICYLRSRALLAQYDGKPEQAIVFLHEAASLAEEIGVPRECWQILIQMGKLYKDLHQPQQATAAFAQARTIVQTLADRIQDETLRQRFLEAHQTILPLVRIDAG